MINMNNCKDIFVLVCRWFWWYGSELKNCKRVSEKTWITASKILFNYSIDLSRNFHRWEIIETLTRITIGSNKRRDLIWWKYTKQKTIGIWNERLYKRCTTLTKTLFIYLCVVEEIFISRKSTKYRCKNKSFSPEFYGIFLISSRKRFAILYFSNVILQMNHSKQSSDKLLRLRR